MDHVTFYSSSSWCNIRTNRKNEEEVTFTDGNGHVIEDDEDNNGNESDDEDNHEYGSE